MNIKKIEKYLKSGTKGSKESMEFLKSISDEELTIGTFLHAIRLAEELNQTEFSKRLRLSNQHLCDIEKGRKIVSPARAAEFARRLGYSEKQFVRLALQEELERAGLEMTVEVA